MVDDSPYQLDPDRNRRVSYLGVVVGVYSSLFTVRTTFFPILSESIQEEASKWAQSLFLFSHAHAAAGLIFSRSLDSFIFEPEENWYSYVDNRRTHYQRIHDEPTWYQKDE